MKVLHCMSMRKKQVLVHLQNRFNLLTAVTVYQASIHRKHMKNCCMTMLGDGTNFTHWDEVALAWQFVDSILRVWENEKADFPNYDSGSMGPDEAEQLLEQDGFHWWSITDDSYK